MVTFDHSHEAEKEVYVHLFPFTLGSVPQPRNCYPYVWVRDNLTLIYLNLKSHEDTLDICFHTDSKPHQLIDMLTTMLLSCSFVPCESLLHTFSAISPWHDVCRLSVFSLLIVASLLLLSLKANLSKLFPLCQRQGMHEPCTGILDKYFLKNDVLQLTLLKCRFCRLWALLERVVKCFWPHLTGPIRMGPFHLD